MRKFEKLLTHLLFVSLTIFIVEGKAQLSFLVAENILYPDFNLVISENSFFPDFSINISRSVRYPDFTVGFTNIKSKADFIISNSNNAYYKIKVSNNSFSPDLRINVGENILYADLSILVATSGSVDYLIYSDKDFPGVNDIIASLLLVIHAKTKFKNDALNRLFKNLLKH